MPEGAKKLAFLRELMLSMMSSFVTDVDGLALTGEENLTVARVPPDTIGVGTS